MKNNFFEVLCIFFVIFNFSCSNSNSKKNIKQDITLKSEIQTRIQDTFWTEELEKDRLTQDISKKDSINSNINISPIIYNNSLASKNQIPIYPIYLGFASLDISNLDKDVKKLADDFCTKLSNFEDVDNFFEVDNVYEFFFFYDELKNFWTKNFDFEMPQKIEIQEESESEEKSNVKEKETVLFASYIFGQPNESHNQCELPVRFFVNSKNAVDVLIYFTKKLDSWKIDQIKITNMGQISK